MTVQASERVLEQVNHALRGAVDGLCDGRGVVSHRKRLMAFHARLQHATFVIVSVFVARILARAVAPGLVHRLCFRILSRPRPPR